MPEQMFIRTLNMSLTGSAVILAVLLLRLLLKKAPRIFSYCLWGAVLFRLLCPVSFTAAFSPFSILNAPAASDGRLQYIPQDILRMQPDRQAFFTDAPSGKTAGNSTAKDSSLQRNGKTAKNSIANAKTSTASRLLRILQSQKTAKAAAFVWICGTAVLLLYNLINSIKLKQRLKGAVWQKENIYLTQHIPTPFVIGIFLPKIYLPAQLRPDETAYVLLHEQIHIKRKDHITRLLSCLALCVHWFNPLVWAAFFLSGRDMEMSCDEAVLRRMGSTVKKKYSSSLLSIAAGANAAGLNGGLLTFGKGDTKSRIKHILHYKKPASILMKSAALVCVAAVIILLANPDTGAKNTPSAAPAQIQAAQNDVVLTNASQKDSASLALSNASQKDPESQALSDTSLKGINSASFTEIYVRSINQKKRLISSYLAPPDSPLADGKKLAFAQNCRFFINHSMDGEDYRETSFPLFASLIKLGGKYLNKACFVQIKAKKVAQIYLESAWEHYGISPMRYTPVSDLYDTLLQSEGEDAFHKNYSLASSQTMDIAECEGDETIEVYTENGKNAGSGIVLFQSSDGKLLFSQDANTSRAGWANIYLGSMDNQPFILNVSIEDRWNFGAFSYQVFRLDQEGTPILSAGSQFEFHLAEGSSLVYDDDMFGRWIKPLKTYLEQSRLVLSSQDGVLRTEQISEADKYNYEALNLEERAIEISTNENSLVRFGNCWYGKQSLKKETVDWLLWYNSLSDTGRLAVSFTPPELVEAKDLVEAATQDADVGQ
ncbi:MAG: M56 family metallopeptidase [Eubacterium sp.]|nr:M56 family metallopeptidase [Eubacterium sp.]